MTPDAALQLLSSLLWTALLVSAPLLAAILLVGLLVSVFQTVTQIQEMSLTYIPKLVVAVVVLGVAGPWMLHGVIAFSVRVIAGIPQGF